MKRANVSGKAEGRGLEEDEVEATDRLEPSTVDS